MSHMLALLAVATAVKLSYSFPVDVKRSFDVQTVFDGFIPLLGGREGKVEVDLVVSAIGQKPADDGNSQVLSTLDDIKVLLDGSPLQIVTLAMTKDYFPPTTISMTPYGQTLKTNAPNLQLPVKLPGLDIKRFPDITYLPLQLPEEGAEIGKTYTFKRAFGDSDITYSATPKKITDDSVEMDLTVAQNYTVLENEGKEVVKEEKDAISSVATVMSGTGTAIFDRKLGAFNVVKVSANADSTVTDLATKKVSQRKLKFTLSSMMRK